MNILFFLAFSTTGFVLPPQKNNAHAVHKPTGFLIDYKQEPSNITRQELYHER